MEILGSFKCRQCGKVARTRRGGQMNFCSRACERRFIQLKAQEGRDANARRRDGGAPPELPTDRP
jgi:hypothetical protein